MEKTLTQLRANIEEGRKDIAKEEKQAVKDTLKGIGYAVLSGICMCKTIRLYSKADTRLGECKERNRWLDAIEKYLLVDSKRKED